MQDLLKVISYWLILKFDVFQVRRQRWAGVWVEGVGEGRGPPCSCAGCLPGCAAVLFASAKLKIAVCPAGPL